MTLSRSVEKSMQFLNDNLKHFAEFYATSILAYFDGRASSNVIRKSPWGAPVGRQGNAVVDTSVTPPPGVEGSSAAAWTFREKEMTDCAQ